MFQNRFSFHLFIFLINCLFHLFCQDCFILINNMDMEVMCGKYSTNACLNSFDWISSIIHRISVFSSGLVCGLSAYSFRKPQRKKFNGVKLHNLGGQFNSPRREIIYSGNFICNNEIVSTTIWQIILFCWKQTSSHIHSVQFRS